MEIYRKGPVKLEVGVIEQHAESPEDDLIDKITLRVILPTPYEITREKLENAGFKSQLPTGTPFSYYETGHEVISILEREDRTTNLHLTSREVRRRNITGVLYSLISLYSRLTSTVEGVNWGYSKGLEEELYASCNRPFEHKLFTFTDSPQQAIINSINVWKRVVSASGINTHTIEWGMKEIGDQVGTSLDVALGHYLVGEIEDDDYAPTSTSEINEGLQRLGITRDGWLQDLNLMPYLERTIKEFNLSEVEIRVIRRATQQGIDHWRRGEYDLNVI